jgi:hypothetical protein
MFMSLSSAVPRTQCIRCGGVEFRLVENSMMVRPAPVPFVPGRSSTDHAGSSLELATIALSESELEGEGAYI